MTVNSRKPRFELFRLIFTFSLLAAPWAALAQAGEQTTGEQLVVVSNDEVVGTLDVVHAGPLVEITYRVDNNGRGPKIDEKITLDERGYPLDWRITGASTFGAAVDEHYQWRDGVAKWRSQADSGMLEADAPPMYIGGDDSPWSLGMYARALLEAPDQALEVLPSGRMQLEALEILEVGEESQPVTLYQLSGLQLDPTLFALDSEHRLFARFGGRGGLVRKGFEDALPRLNEWARDHERKRLQGLQQKLAHTFDAPVRYRNVRVFDPHAKTTGEPVSVLVKNGLVESIDPDPAAGEPQSEVIVDGQGGTLVAGLTDMHAHNSMDSGLFYLAAGVTSTRDMGNDIEVLPGIMRAIEAGELAGTRITPAGLIEARSPYSARIGIVADTLDEALEAVRWYAGNGYYEIKTYNSMEPDWVEPLVAEARKHGLGVTGHVPAFVHPEQVIAYGYDAIAHINQLMLGWLLEPGEDTRTPLRLTAMKRGATLDLDTPQVRKTVDLMRKHGTALDTTAVILERLMLSRAGEVQPGDVPYLDHMPIGYQRYRSRTFVPLEEPGDDAAYREGFETLLGVIRLLHDNGIPLLVGTDDGTGFTVHRELELYVKAGIPAPDTLAMATLGTAKYLDKAGEVGSIEPGKHADFFLVPGDPAEDISQVRRIRLVSRGGVIYFPEEIYSELGIEPFASAVELKAPEPAPHPWFAPTRIDDAPVLPLARTSHSGRYNGKNIEYDVIAGELLLEGDDGEPAATMFSTAYVRTDTNSEQRPVLFLFNGGPGASSSPLHLGVGPVRRPVENDDTVPQGELVPNVSSPIDVVDMVFVDPVGTGFTRLFKEGAGEQFWGIEKDADSVLHLMHEWLVRNDREDSPVFVMGESYGGTRAVVVAARAGKVDIDGVLLLSPALDFTAGTEIVGNNLPYMALLPTMAATAAYHGVTDRKGRSGLEIFNDAAEYALSDYAAALYQGNTISAREKAAVARDLARLTGLEASYILESNLRISRSEFGDRLLGDAGMRIGRLDTRAKGPIEEYRDKRPPRNDPSMSGGQEGGPSTGDLLQEYFNGPLGVAIDRPYRTLNLDLNQKWDWEREGFSTYLSVAPQLQQAMKDDPDLRVFIGGGIYDMGTPIMAARYTAGQIDADPGRFELAGYEGGHATFEHEESRVALCNDIRTFVRQNADR